MIWVLGFGTWLFALSCVFVYNDLSVDVQSALVELEKCLVLWFRTCVSFEKLQNLIPGQQCYGSSQFNKKIISVFFFFSL